jgi:hypothetical protein
MTTQQTDLVRRALSLLNGLVPSGEPCACDGRPRRCPATQFAARYLIREAAGDMTSQELWRFFVEVTTSGELEPLSKAEFLRRLPAAMESVFGARKCHGIDRAGRRVRGFRCIGIRLDADPVKMLEPEPE